jgi:hypothetical protein
LAEVTYHLPRGSVSVMDHVERILEEVDDYCRSGQELLTLAPAQDVAAYRDWVSREVRRQYAGEAPTPWPVFAARRGLPA